MGNEIINYAITIELSIVIILNSFLAYCFWISKDGKLRKLWISNHLCLVVMFLTFLVMIKLGHPTRLMAVVGVIPYTISMVALISFVIKQTKNGSN